ncbi:Late embryogenesis abundant (LEA) hydroxyproline-rich glycoprotein family [Quillaja saponaria]|uniref:Late embryogenesis abundant (LEA) hydroxyproline-rich glycoprotein family n=1 Tax=Quillaja saponaria TaxID=32244 RepID=A0AAD7PR44_QUISA|nr:Late embryogenesis abundant (LEA) hydroxyproline-rich glycoprotein family [Quillaja saponaria]
MADRVHPRDSPPTSVQQSEAVLQKPPSPASEKPAPPPGTYVVQIPKDQIFRVPPPENARRYQQYTSRKTRRSGCCCCLFWLLGLIVTVVVLLAIAAGIFYLVFKPESPNYTVERISIKGINLTTTSSTATISPEFSITVRAENPNDKIGIYYKRKSSIEVHYNNVELCNGALPVFYQPSNNVTVFQTALKGSSIELTSTDHKTLVDAQNKKNVPFKLNLRAPVKIKVGSIKTWTITVKVNCDVAVDKLTAQAKVVSKNCDYGVDLW